MKNKTLLLASFIYPDKKEWFLKLLEDRFEIKSDNVFTYEDLGDESKLILTFKITIDEDERLDLRKLFPSTILIHKKGDALYTINALNKLIESMNENQVGNIDYKSVKIDWSDYQNKFLLTTNNQLNIHEIKRIL